VRTSIELNADDTVIIAVPGEDGHVGYPCSAGELGELLKHRGTRPAKEHNPDLHIRIGSATSHPMICGEPTAAGKRCRNPRRCRWHDVGAGEEVAVIPAHRGSPARAWRRSAERYTSRRLRHLNPQEPQPNRWGGGPDGDGGEELPA
jgi:hypothetical protein